MTFTTENAVQTFGVNTGAEFDEDAWLDMWEAFNALPVGSVIATTHGENEGGGTIYFEKASDTDFAWRVVQVDQSLLDMAEGDEVMTEVTTVGYVETMDSAVIDGGGDLDAGFVIRVGA